MKFNLSKLKLRLKFKYFKHIHHATRVIFWFFTGAALALFFISTSLFFIYQKIYDNKVYPGIYVNNVNFGTKTKQEVKAYFVNKNSQFGATTFVLSSDYGIATFSAKDINYGYNKDLSADQAYAMGRSENIFSDLSIILQAYINGVYLPATYTYDQNKLQSIIQPVSDKIEKKPVDALFTFTNNRASAFRPSENGQTVDIDLLNTNMLSKALTVASYQKPQVITLDIPIKTIFPNVTTDKVNNMGIKELIGTGHSLFYHSIPGRVFNVNLAASRINGVLVAPNEVFSFDKALGDVSAFTGYKQAYIIQNGKTVLGDGGGVCQVSTTFFRALLDAGLPIVERHAHAYRVGYYEEDSPPGIDATVFVPSVDLKFKNDTGHYILIQSEVDLDNLSLTFNLYGTKDGRQVSMTKPVVTNQTPPPPDLYQDDPTLPKGTVKQTDFAAWGADVSFTRTVTKNNKVIISDKFVSDYQPWQAIYLRGTQ